MRDRPLVGQARRKGRGQLCAVRPHRTPGPCRRLPLGRWQTLIMGFLGTALDRLKAFDDSPWPRRPADTTVAGCTDPIDQILARGYRVRAGPLGIFALGASWFVLGALGVVAVASPYSPLLVKVGAVALAAFCAAMLFQS